MDCAVDRGSRLRRRILLEREPPARPSLEELLQREPEDEDALSLADFDEQ
jgi:hypothetical protein